MSNVTKPPDLQTGYDYVTDNEPANPIEGQTWYAPTANTASVWDGAAWRNLAVSDHGQLSGVASSDHHAKTTSASDLTDVSADSVEDAHRSDSNILATVDGQVDADSVDGYEASALQTPAQTGNVESFSEEFLTFAEPWSDGDISTSEYFIPGRNSTKDFDVEYGTSVFADGIRVYLTPEDNTPTDTISVDEVRVIKPDGTRIRVGEYPAFGEFEVYSHLLTEVSGAEMQVSNSSTDDTETYHLNIHEIQPHQPGHIHNV